MSGIIKSLQILAGAYKAEYPNGLNEVQWRGVLERYGHGISTLEDRDLVRRMAEAVLRKAGTLTEGLSHAVRRFGALNDLTTEANLIPHLENILRFHTLEGERLDVEGNLAEARVHFQQAARIASRLIWEYERLCFNMTREGRNPSQLTDRLSDASQQLALLVERLPGIVRDPFLAGADKITLDAFEAFARGDTETAQKILAIQVQRFQANPFKLPLNLGLYESIELSILLEKEEDPAARLEIQIQLFHSLQMAYQGHRGWFEQEPGLATVTMDHFQKLEGLITGLVCDIVVGTIRFKRVPQEQAMLNSGWISSFFPSPLVDVLRRYWSYRMSGTLEDPALLPGFDLLITKIRELYLADLLPGVILDDALAFRERAVRPATTGAPRSLFPPPPVIARRAPPPDLEPKIFRTGLKLLESRLGEIIPGNVDAMRRKIRKYQDALTLRLAEFADLLNANMRFTDVLPQIEEDAEMVVDHFREYFPQTDPRLPAMINVGIKAAHSHLPKGAVSMAIRRAVRMMASLYIAGDSFASAKKTFLKMAGNGEGIIADVLGEAVTTDGEADAYMQSYLNLIAELPSHGDLIEQTRANRSKTYSVPIFAPEHQADVQMAIKLSALVPISQWNATDPSGTGEAVKKRLRRVLDSILQMGREKGIKICLTIDPEEVESREMIYRIFKEVFMEEPYRPMTNVGIGLQAYLKDSEEVLDDFARWSAERGHSVMIRLIKGAYWDAENLASSQKGFDLPVFPEKWMSDVNFERLADKLFDYSDSLRAAFGSHNARSLAYVIEQARARVKPIEIEMLYGMADETKEDLVKMGLPVWVYSPMGKLLPGMAYLSRRILENSSQNSFLLQRKSGKNPEELLQNPLRGHEHEWPPVFKKRVIDHSDPAAVFENEPLTDFARQENRVPVRWALEALRRGIKVNANSYALIIGGQKVFTGRTIISTNPSDPSEVIGIVARAGVEEAKNAVKVAEGAFKGWQESGVKKRGSYLFKAAQIMRREKADLTALVMLEAGKTLREADAEVAEAIDFLDYYARQAIRLETENPDLQFDPLGVTAVIAPWNFPLAILTGMTAASLVMGNTVIIKPASQTPVIGARLAEILGRAGIPPGVVHYLPGGGAALREAGVKAIAFTGSLEVGLDIYEKETPKGVKVIAELGGKNAMIIDRDAHPDDVIKIVLESKFGYSGQKCSALDRLIIVGDEAHFRTMVDRLVEAAKTLRVGKVDDFGNYYGPVIDKETHDRLEQLIATAQEQGGRILLSPPLEKGGWGDLSNVSPPPKGVEGGFNGQGYFLGPTILEVNDVNSPLFQDEFFGPVLAVKRAQTLEEAVQIAQNTKYGLTAGYIGRSPKNEKYVVENLVETGNLYINRRQTAAVVGRQPFGGVKLSGIGSKAGGRDYLLQFAKARFKDPVLLEPQSIFSLVGAATVEKMMKGDVYQPEILGETNRVQLHPRGAGLIFLDYHTGFGQAFGLLSAALFSGNDVRVLAAPNRRGELEILEGAWKKVRRDGFFGEILGMNPDELTRLVTDPAYQWVAYAGSDKTNRDSAYRKSVAAAVATGAGQRFVRSVIAPDDVLAESNTVIAGMTYPRTVTVNTARHGFDARGAKIQEGQVEIAAGGIEAGEPEEHHIPEGDRRARHAMAMGVKMFGLARSGRTAVAHLQRMIKR